MFLVAEAAGSACVAGAEVVAVNPGTVIVGELSPGVSVKDGGKEVSPESAVRLVCVADAGSRSARIVRSGPDSSADVITWVLMLVYVALNAKGVSVGVPPLFLLTIFGSDSQAAIDQARAIKMIGIK